ncbi:MAG: elongation factor P [Candidatus Anoxymicrobium japonicum]|uniref:Elongation factor P n=1 Tax=Candidatus Anoxymicrobium japonicum TaxID=2013648 RepID=A0A2N3G7K9_9ACTN|nr:MAG: elongation factor P [Candidatus Anoxymicrobium japonicum]
MSVSTAEFRNGLVLDLDGPLMRIIEFQHVKPGKGGAFVRTKLKNVETGKVIDKTFRAGEKLEEAVLEHRRMQYLYKDGGNDIFMDLESFEQVHVAASVIGEDANFLVENQELSVFTRNGNAVTIELPPAVTLRVSSAEPWLKGDTSSGATKPVTLETGLVVQAPLFVNVGDALKVDTRTGRYMERA